MTYYVLSVMLNSTHSTQQNTYDHFPLTCNKIKALLYACFILINSHTFNREIKHKAIEIYIYICVLCSITIQSVFIKRLTKHSEYNER